MAKNISINTIRKKAGLLRSAPIAINVGENETCATVVVKPYLPLKDRQRMVSDIVDMVFIEDEQGNENYYAHLKTFAYGYNILSYFTNIKMGDDAEKIWAFINNTGVLGMVKEAIGVEYVNEIISEANEMIEFRKESILRKSKLEKIFGGALDSISSVIGSLQNIDLGDLIGLISDNMPEFKGQIEKLLKVEEEPDKTTD